MLRSCEDKVADKTVREFRHPLSLQHRREKQSKHLIIVSATATNTERQEIVPAYIGEERRSGTLTSSPDAHVVVSPAVRVPVGRLAVLFFVESSAAEFLVSLVERRRRQASSQPRVGIVVVSSCCWNRALHQPADWWRIAAAPLPPSQPTSTDGSFENVRYDKAKKEAYFVEYLRTYWTDFRNIFTI